MLIKQYQTERTFSPHYRNHFNDFLSTFKFQYYYSYGDSLPKNDIEVYYLRKSNGLQNYSLVYSSYPTSKKPMGGLAGNVRPCQNYNQSAEKGIVWLGTILCICYVVVVGIVYHVTLDISNPLMGKLCVLNVNITQLLIQIKQNVYHLHKSILKSLTYKELSLLLFQYWDVFTTHLFLQ